MAKRKSDYFGLGYIVSLILAIIPVTSWILGAITRFSEGKIVAGLLRLVFGFNIVARRPRFDDRQKIYLASSQLLI